MAGEETRSLWAVSSGKTAALERQVKMSERLASAIVGLVIEQGLKEGDRLPNESEMVEQFGVARLTGRTLGERMRALVAVSHPDDRAVLLAHEDSG